MRSSNGQRHNELYCPMHNSIALQGPRWGCPECGSTLRPRHDVTEIDMKAPRPQNIYRYHELLPPSPDPNIGLHTGWTPLVSAPRLASELGLADVKLKLDCYNWPSYSYKDRVVACALQRAKELGYDKIACVSTGNVGNSLAALTAAAGMTAVIFYPAGLEAAKNVMTLAHGAVIIQLEGTYDEVNSVCRDLALKGVLPFVNLTLRPYYAEGAKTVAYEIAEQSGGVFPQHVVVPAAGAALLTRMAFGFEEAAELGMAEGQPPRVHAAQAAGCSPIAEAFRTGADSILAQAPMTFAKSIAIGNPSDGKMALNVIRKSGGTASAVSDEEIRDGIKLLASTEGIFAEPAGGTAVAVTRNLAAKGVISPEDTTVIAITGTGLKTLKSSSGDGGRIFHGSLNLREAENILAKID